MALAMPPNVVRLLCVSSLPWGPRIGSVSARDTAGSGSRRAPRVRSSAIADRSNAAASHDNDTADGVDTTAEAESDSTSTSTSLVDDILATIANTDSGRLVKAGFSFNPTYRTGVPELTVC
jgi:hypothetical protein